MLWLSAKIYNTFPIEVPDINPIKTKWISARVGSQRQELQGPPEAENSR